MDNPSRPARASDDPASGPSVVLHDRRHAANVALVAMMALPSTTLTRTGGLGALTDRTWAFSWRETIRAPARR